MQDDKDIANELRDRSHLGKQRGRKAVGNPTKLLPRSCVHCGVLGLKENGFCTLYDSTLNPFTAYCDVTSEPGYAWTLVTSFSRQVVQTEVNQVSGLNSKISLKVVKYYHSKHYFIHHRLFSTS